MPESTGPGRGPATTAHEARIRKAAAKFSEQLSPGDNADFTVRRKGRYEMAAIMEDECEEYETSPIHVAVSLEFLRCLPHYRINSMTKDVFWSLVGLLSERDEDGRYVHLNAFGEVKVKQEDLAKLMELSVRSVNRAMVELMKRNFVWKSGRGKYQIHPEILYFGTSNAQLTAKGYASARRKDGRLPAIPAPGVFIEEPQIIDGVPVGEIA